VGAARFGRAGARPKWKGGGFGRGRASSWNAAATEPMEGAARRLFLARLNSLRKNQWDEKKPPLRG